MDRIGSRTWMIVGIAGILLFLSYWVRFTAQRTARIQSSPGFSYEMPRPQNYDPAFDLSDREVVRQYKSLPTVEELKKAEEAKKAALAKKQGTKTTPKKAAAKKPAAAQAQKKKSQATVNVVNTNFEMEMTQDSVDEWSPAGVAAAVFPKVADAKKENDKDKDEDEDLKLTAPQWRALLQSEPTGKNLAKFVKAKHAGKIEAAAYYQIVHELLIDNAADRRKAALAILDMDASAATFEFMVTESATAPSEVQTPLKSRIESYAEASKIGFLVRVLAANKNEAVLQSGTSRLSAALAEFKKNSTTSEVTTTSRNGTTTTQTVHKQTGSLTLQHFTPFVPVLQRLSKSGSVSTQATSLLTEIQNLSKSKT